MFWKMCKLVSSGFMDVFSSGVWLTCKMKIFTAVIKKNGRMPEVFAAMYGCGTFCGMTTTTILKTFLDVDYGGFDPWLPCVTHLRN